MAKEEKYFHKVHQRTIKGDSRKQSYVMLQHRKNSINKYARLFSESSVV
jgi:hypothetical protein